MSALPRRSKNAGSLVFTDDEPIWCTVTIFFLQIVCQLSALSFLDGAPCQGFLWSSANISGAVMSSACLREVETRWP